MNKKMAWYKKKVVWKWIGIVFVALCILGAILPEPPEEKSDVKEVVKEPTEQKDKNKEIVVTEEEEKVQKDSETTKDLEIKNKPAEIKILTKEEVLKKFEMDADIAPYINKPFIFKDSSTDIADYYALADNDRYRNASVIFKDGQIARVKLIPLNNIKAEILFEEFGISSPLVNRLPGMAGAFEATPIPAYSSQNIERYPFELD